MADAVPTQGDAVLTLEIGTSGLLQFSGFVHEERLRQLLSPRQRNATFREMGDNDPIAGGVLFAVEAFIRGADWHFEPPKDSKDPRMGEKVEFAQSCLDDMVRPFKDVIAEMLSFLQFGFYCGEITMKYRLGSQAGPVVSVDQNGALTVNGARPVSSVDLDLDEYAPASRFNDGRLGWHKIAGRAQDTVYNWIFDKHGEVLAMVQQAPPDWNTRVIPMSKLIHLRTTARNNNPEGQSIFRRAYRPWYFKKTVEELQAIGLERDLAGLAVLRVPANLMRPKSTLDAAELSQRIAMEKLLRNLRRGQQDGIMLPSGSIVINGQPTSEKAYDIELLGQGGRRQFDTTGMLEYYDKMIAMMALADVMLLGHEDVGSFALASSKTQMMLRSIAAWLDMISDQFDRRLTPQLMEVNGFDTDEVPHLAHSDLDAQDLGVLGDYIAKLSAAGMPIFPTPDGRLERVLLEEAGLPTPTEDEWALMNEPDPVAPVLVGPDGLPLPPSSPMPGVTPPQLKPFADAAAAKTPQDAPTADNPAGKVEKKMVVLVDRDVNGRVIGLHSART